MKSLAALIKWASLVPQEMLHVERSSNFREILNQECAVLPPSIKSAEIPEEATANVTFPHDRTVASKVLYKKVLPVPLGPSTKKQVPALSIEVRTAS
jgi:hypothetical protein